MSYWKSKNVQSFIYWTMNTEVYHIRWIILFRVAKCYISRRSCHKRVSRGNHLLPAAFQRNCKTWQVNGRNWYHLELSGKLDIGDPNLLYCDGLKFSRMHVPMYQWTSAKKFIISCICNTHFKWMSEVFIEQSISFLGPLCSHPGSPFFLFLMKSSFSQDEEDNSSAFHVVIPTSR